MPWVRARRLPLLAAGLASLLYGVAVGLVRLGWPLPLADVDRLDVHGPLMVCGFVGTLVTLERAVTRARRWAFAAPALAASGALVLLAAPGARVAALLMALASLALVLMQGVSLRRRPSVPLAVAGLGAAFWLAGNVLWLAGWPIFRLVSWWIGFPVLTIAGSRLESAWRLGSGGRARLALVAIAVGLFAGAVLAGAQPLAPPRLAGLALAALALLLLRHDAARRAMEEGGVTGFTAWCLRSGYAWLGVGGALALFHPGEFSGPAYDAVLHAVFLGFLLSVIFGQAPIVIPSVLQGRAAFDRGFYAHLLLLHASVALRVAGDLSGAWSDGSWGRARAWGGALNAAAVLLFLANTVRSLRFRGDGAAPGDAREVRSPLDFLPARWVPLLYLGFAHLALVAAFAVVAAEPRGVAGFYYHPHLVAVVHMVTLGWITGSILGSLYVVGPLAFRMPLLAGAGDYAAFAAFAIGVAGMVSHFWIDRLSGMAWAALLVLAALAFVGGRVLGGLRRAPVPGQARLPVALAIVNVLAAALLGILLGVNKTHPFLPASQLQVVLGHAHLAVLGWAALMVMGAGYRLLPMILPAAMPRGAWPYVATLLTEAGAWGILAAFFAGGRWVAPAACVAAAGVAVFLAQAVWMARHRRPPPAEMPRPDLSLGHALQALAYLALTTAIGVGLAFAAPSEASLRWTMAYGTLGLVGFLSQVVVGVGGRLLPLYGWLWGFADSGHKELPVSLHRAGSRPAQAITLALWSLGVPALAGGMAFDRPGLLRAAGAALALAVVLGGGNLVLILRRLWSLRAR